MKEDPHMKKVRATVKAVQEAAKAIGTPVTIYPTGRDAQAGYAIAIDLRIPVPEHERIHSVFPKDDTIEALREIARHKASLSAYQPYPAVEEAWHNIVMATDAACEVRDLPEKTETSKNAVYKRYQKIYHQNKLNACQQKTEGFLKEMLVRGVTADEVLKAMKHAVKGHDKTEGVQRAPETTR